MSNSRRFWGILAVLLMLGLEGCVPAEPFFSSTVAPPPVGLRQIAKNSLGLREYWRVPHTCLGASPSSLAAASDRVICLYYDPASNRQSIRVFDAARGSLSWEAGRLGSGLESVYADNKRVYLKSMFEIHAYGLDNGQQLWAKSVPIKGGILYPDGEKLYLLKDGGGGPWILYTLDARTGDTLSSESVSTDNDFVLLARFPQFDLYFGLTPGSAKRPLRVVDRSTQQIRWEIKDSKILSLPHWPPVLIDGVLLIDSGEAVTAFDAQSGEVRWRSGDIFDSSHAILFATKSVVMDGSLYALRYDGRLVRLDPRTGKEIGHIQFEPALPDYSPQDKFFALATDGKMLFVSFDDSNELIALGP